MYYIHTVIFHHIAQRYMAIKKQTNQYDHIFHQWLEKYSKHAYPNDHYLKTYKLYPAKFFYIKSAEQFFKKILRKVKKILEKIAIIVPIYNVENYLRQCLDSIQKQTYTNFICIMINDGSTDSSKEIAETYLVDDRFVLINQENQGLSGARNRGIEFLLKELEKKEAINFVSFVDSDDVLAFNFLEELIKHIEDDIDIVEANVATIIEHEQPTFSSSDEDEFILENY